MNEMSNVSPKEAFHLYTTYIALKQHFTTDSYDYFKFQGKTRVTVDSFERRKDKYFFYKLARVKNAEELLLANMVLNPKIWVGDLVNNDETQSIFKNWKKRQESISYVFKTEIGQLDDEFKSNFKVKDGQYPYVIKLYLQNKLSLETLVILTDFINCIPYWNEKISDTIVWPDINRSISKYRGFIDYDVSKIKKILLDRFDI